MQRLAFQQVDVFTAVPFKGNPVAVVFEGDTLSSEQMQSIANWTNLSETTFVCTATSANADYRLRIFTPNSELQFAGHPTIGSAHAILKNGYKPRAPGRLVQECARGLVALRIDGEKIFLSLPDPVLRSVPDDQRSELAAALQIDPGSVRASAVVDVGVTWITLQLGDDELVRKLKPQQERLCRLTPSGAAGVTVFALRPSGADTEVEVRSFAPAVGIPEDPVCGSGNGCVAALLRQERLLTKKRYVAAQGCMLGRAGRVEVQYDEDGTIWLGGCAVTCIEGTLQVGANAAGDPEQSMLAAMDVK
jgi:PhzF family phenazine biosynthesis protein